MKKYFFILLLFITTLIAEDYYTDRFLVYVNNDQTDFAYLNDGPGMWTNNETLNRELAAIGTIDFRPWIRTATPEDRDGDVYLNRIFEVVLGTDRADLSTVLEEVRNIQGLSNPEVLGKNYVTYTPNDPQFNQQWFLPNIQATEAWDLWDIDNGEIPGYVTDRVIKVGIVDDGCHWTHPDLIGNIWNNLGEDLDGDGITVVQNGNSWEFDPDDINGIDDDGDGFVDNFIGWDVGQTSSGSEDNNPLPSWSNSHGTMVSGSASGVTNNGTGIAAVGWSIKILPVKCSYQGDGLIHFGYDGMLAAAQQGADVINLSWGGFSFSSYAQNVVNTCYNTYGSIIVASAGNGNEDYGVTNFDTHYPSGYDNVISVTATGNGDQFNCWATAGTTVDLGAPGESIRTTDGLTGYSSVFGTSFSSPITSGAIALVWSKFPTETKEWVIDKIINSTDYYPDMDGNCTVRNYGDSQSHVESMTGMLGSGRLNVFKALAGGIYPSLYVQDINLQNDTDGDGIFNPGETVNAKIIVGNEDGWATATNVIAVLSTTDPRITITDNSIQFTGDIGAGSSAFTLFDSFQFSATADAVTGNIPFTVTMYAGADPYVYVIEEEIFVELSLNQSGFPYATSSSVKTSPVVADLNGDGESEIYFGSDNFDFYGLAADGTVLPGFPYTTGNQVRSSPAIADLQGDGDKEIVFGSKDRSIHVLNYDGTVDLTFLSDGYIMDSPVLTDLDQDGDLEIVFGTFETGNTGKVYAIHHDGSAVTGFPVAIGEVIMVAPAVADLDNDGELDIVIGTWSNNIYCVSESGTVKPGFPFPANGRINVAPALANLTGDSQLEIAAGSDDGTLYIIDAAGTEVSQVTSGSMIRGGISFYDMNNDGYPEVLFGSQDRNIYFHDVNNNVPVTGWPVPVSGAIYSAPAVSDVNGDGTPDIIAGLSSGITAMNLDGSLLGNMPIAFSAVVESSPVIEDLDHDGDLEVIIGSSIGLQVQDIKTSGGSTQYWHVYRGNALRTGSYDDIYLAVDSDEDMGIPNVFSVSKAYPNPFNPNMHFSVALPEEAHILVSIYNLMGQEVTRLANETLAPGSYTFTWQGRDRSGAGLATGIYLIAVQYEGAVHTQKVLFIK
ncbi:MAG: S8 family serine peptidase [Fidelibacterota bacterium]